MQSQIVLDGWFAVAATPFVPQLRHTGVAATATSRQKLVLQTQSVMEVEPGEVIVESTHCVQLPVDATFQKLALQTQSAMDVDPDGAVESTHDVQVPLDESIQLLTGHKHCAIDVEPTEAVDESGHKVHTPAADMK